MVAVSVHAGAVDQVGAATGDDLTAAHVHGDAHHAVGRHATAGRRHHSGHLGATGLRVEVGPSAALPVQLGVWVVGVSGAAGRRPP